METELFLNNNVVQIFREFPDYHGQNIQVCVSNEDDAYRLLDILNNEGFTWNSGHNLLDYNVMVSSGLIEMLQNEGRAYVRMNKNIRVTVSSTYDSLAFVTDFKVIADRYKLTTFKEADFGSVNELL